MKTINLTQIHIIGITVRTTNKNNQATTDIGNLWNQLLSENIAGQIPNKVDNTIYSVYTEYDQDYIKPYTALLGCRVSTLEYIPRGFVGKIINRGDYALFTAKGKLADGIVFQEWIKIWTADIPRAYTTDFEVYDEKSQDSENAEVDVFVAVK